MRTKAYPNGAGPSIATAPATEGLNGYVYRLRQAVKALELARGRDVSQEELGRLVAKAMNRRHPFTAVAASRWLRGRRPTYPVMAALARSLGVTPGWLAFGEQEELVRKSIAAAAQSRAALRQAGGLEQRSGSPGRRRADRAS